MKKVSGDVGGGFVGERKAGEPEEFKLLELDGEFLLIGALEGVYNVSVKTMKGGKTIRWESSAKDQSVCQMKGNSRVSSFPRRPPRPSGTSFL